MSYLEALQRRDPRKADDPLFLRAQLEAFKALMANPRGRSAAELKPIAAAMDEIEAALGPARDYDKAALMERARERARELGVEL